jgi:hypothetical protein
LLDLHPVNTLLSRVSEFMADQIASARRAGVEHASRKMDLAAFREREGAVALSLLRRRVVATKFHVAEVRS